jgi:hypothetical protein
MVVRLAVIPLKKGIRAGQRIDSRLRGNDGDAGSATTIVIAKTAFEF